MFGSQSDIEKPVQLYHLDNTQIQCHLMQPDQALKQGIHYYWHISVAAGSVDLEVIPDNAIDLVMSPDIPDFSRLFFPVAEKFTVPLEGPIRYVGVCFKIDQLSLYFGQPSDQLKVVQEGKQTTSLLEIQPMLDELSKLSDFPAIKSLFDSAFYRFAGYVSYQSTEAGSLEMANVIAAMQETLGDAGMSELASRFEMSERQFRRVLTNTFGFGPKKVQRVVRLQMALAELIFKKSGGMLDGYYDDAHRIRELRSLTGVTPGQIQRMAEIYNQSE